MLVTSWPHMAIKAMPSIAPSMTKPAIGPCKMTSSSGIPSISSAMRPQLPQPQGLVSECQAARNGLAARKVAALIASAP